MAGKPSEERDIFKMVKMIIRRQYDPVVLVSFIKKECELLALQVSKLREYCAYYLQRVKTLFIHVYGNT